MMILKTLIVDDEDYARDIVRSLLTSDPEIDVVAECTNGSEAIEQIKQLRPDLVFLDIQMPEVNGFEVIDSTQSVHIPHYIFTTAYDTFALRAFEVNAIDYLLKPFDDDRFNEALKKAKSRINNASAVEVKSHINALLAAREKESNTFIKRISVKTGSKIHLIKIEDIDWIEADNQYVKIHLGARQLVHRQSLSELESLLNPTLFARIHRSTIVNVNRITTLEPHFRGDFIISLQDGTRLKLAKSRKEALHQLLN